MNLSAQCNAREFYVLLIGADIFIKGFEILSAAIEII
jgi:hypothetical protein